MHGATIKIPDINFSWSVHFNTGWVSYIKEKVAKDRCAPIDGSVPMFHLFTDKWDRNKENTSQKEMTVYR